jgi:glyoxylase-like metal-dependent hydrolase (beta-lactamase superfamily II)
MIVHIESGRERLVYWADTAVHPMFLENPSWHLVADVDGDLASETRRRILNMAASEQPLIAAFHFPFPGLGYVARRGNTYRWEPAMP